MAGRGIRRVDDPAGGRRRSRTGSAASPTSGPARRTCAPKPFKAKIKVDGAPWFDGDASCVLVGNVGRLFGGIEVFEDARPDDGRLELGVVTADGIAEWVRTLARTAVGHAERSPFVQATTATKVKVKLEPQGALRARRRRPEQGQVVQDQRPARRGHPLPTREGAEHTWQACGMIQASPCPSAHAAGEGFVSSPHLPDPSRAGFVARAVIYGIIGLLAFDLAIGHGGKITNQQGALRTVEQHWFGHVLLAALAVGLGGYSLWRLFRAA